MKHRFIDIPNSDWSVDLFILDENATAARAVTRALRDIRCPEDQVAEAEKMMQGRGKNYAFTFCNPSALLSVIALGPTTSAAEFVDSLTHEVSHLAFCIARDEHLDPERTAALVGDIMRAFYASVKSFICPTCRDGNGARSVRYIGKRPITW